MYASLPLDKKDLLPLAEGQAVLLDLEKPGCDTSQVGMCLKVQGQCVLGARLPSKGHAVLLDLERPRRDISTYCFLCTEHVCCPQSVV